MKIYRLKLFSFLLLTFVLLFPCAFATQILQPEYSFNIISRLVAMLLASENYVHPDSKLLSDELFGEYLTTLDPNHLYFTKGDIEDLKKQAGDLYAKLYKGNTSFAFIAYNKLIEKVKQREDFSKKMIQKGFNFNLNEDYVFDRTKSNWVDSESDLDQIWREKLKNDILTYKLMDMLTQDTSIKKDKLKISSLTPEERTLKRLKTYRLYLEETDPVDVLEIYLSTLAKLYDPHSAYMSPRSEDDFNTQMQLSFVGIGALLSSEDGYVKVEKILPGGPAEKSKVLKPSDRIIAVGEEGETPVDVIDMPLNKVVDKIRGKKGTKVYLTILPGEEGASAVPKVVSIERGTVQLKDSEASSKIEVIKDPFGKTMKIGIITLPSFYLDFQGINRGDKNYRSSTKDVKKILLEFNKEHVDGVIVDLRTNGGGSLKEAIDLTGLFIKNGPIVQTKDARGNISVEEDEDNNCYYNGPLIVLVNRLSASAAEIFAGAIQDYGRGIIVGDKNTHGKGTVQTVVDISTLLSRFNLNLKGGAIKLTNAKFYRISGGSTQNKGVVSDIQFDSLLDYMDIGEDSLEHAMPWDSIDAVKYTTLDEKIPSALPILKSKSEARIKNNPDFKNLDSAIKLYLKIKDKKSIPLNEQKRLATYQEEKKILKEQNELKKSIIPASWKSDSDVTSANDMYLNETINIIVDYIDYLNNYKSSSQKIVKTGQLPLGTVQK